MFRILLSPDPTEGGAPASDPPAPAPPPAAKTVNEGERSENEIRLEGELVKERDTVKQREVKIAELEDQIHTLKTTQKASEVPKARKGLFRC